MISKGMGYKQVPRYKMICNMSKLYSNIDFLKKEYGLKDTNIISVRHVSVSNNHYNKKVRVGFRSKFKHIYNGSLSGFQVFCRDFYKNNVWKKKKNS